MDIIAITTIVSLAAIAAALLARLRSEQAAARRAAQENERLLSEKEQYREALQEARTRAAAPQAAADRTLAAAQTEAARQLAETRAEADKRLAEARAEIRIWSERFETQTAERGKLEKQFTDYFQNLANDILEDKTKRFTETNRQNIGDLLRPLGENLEKFRQRIEQEAAERKVLEAEIRRLHETSNQVSREANNLAAARPGPTPAPGGGGGRHGDDVQVDAGRQHPAVVVIGVVAADFGSAGCAEETRLTARTVKLLELADNAAIALFLGIDGAGRIEL